MGGHCQKYSLSLQCLQLTLRCPSTHLLAPSCGTVELGAMVPPMAAANQAAPPARDAPGWPMMTQDGKGWHRVAKDHTGWHSMAKDGTRWHKVARDGTGWHSMAQHGSGLPRDPKPRIRSPGAAPDGAAAAGLLAGPTAAPNAAAAAMGGGMCMRFRNCVRSSARQGHDTGATGT